jgi:hypothetical protein
MPGLRLSCSAALTAALAAGALSACDADLAALGKANDGGSGSGSFSTGGSSGSGGRYGAGAVGGPGSFGSGGSGAGSGSAGSGTFGNPGSGGSGGFGSVGTGGSGGVRTGGGGGFDGGLAVGGSGGSVTGGLGGSGARGGTGGTGGGILVGGFGGGSSGTGGTIGTGGTPGTGASTGTCTLPSCFAELSRTCVAMGRCVMQSTPSSSNVCYENGVKQLTMIGAFTPTGISALSRVTNPNGTTCFTMEILGMSNGSGMVTYRNAAGTIVARSTTDAAGNTSAMCTGGPTVTIPRNCSMPGTGTGGAGGTPGMCATGICP